VHIRRTDKGLALTSSLLPNFTHKFVIQIEAYLLALSHPSHFRHKPLGEGVEGCGWCRELGMEGGDREVGEVNGVCSGSARGLSGGRRGRGAGSGLVGDVGEGGGRHVFFGGYRGCRAGVLI